MAPTARPGVFRRRIVLEAPAADTVDAALEDDFHRFRVTLRHDGARITAVDGAAERYPWSACPGAVARLDGLAGLPLERAASGLGRHADAHTHCTHLFDLAGLATAHAAARRTRRVYDVVIPDRDEGGFTTAEVARDGTVVLAWDLEWGTILGPDPFTGVGLRGGFLRWAEANLDLETAEAACVLRRAGEISFGRNHDWDTFDVAARVGDFMLGVCHTFQPGVAETAVRMRGSIRDFTEDPSAPLT